VSANPGDVGRILARTVKGAMGPVLAELAATKAALAATETALVALQASIAQAAKAEAAAALERRVEALLADVGTVREKVAAVEVKTLQPGPPGAPGKDGTDGLGFDDLECVDDGTGMVLRLTRGDQVKSLALAFSCHTDFPQRLQAMSRRDESVVLSHFQQGIEIL